MTMDYKKFRKRLKIYNHIFGVALFALIFTLFSDDVTDEISAYFSVPESYEIWVVIGIAAIISIAACSIYMAVFLFILKKYRNHE